ncbi:ARL14 effector protein isoform 2-T2 [Anomaloglossus baeobatrachus]|uniref:ARL14 effector protein isoform X2 n=1 Tax=Anomaloglossus baeobatrachus TaxID=238106 RepID=UPI003F500BC8
MAAARDSGASYTGMPSKKTQVKRAALWCSYISARMAGRAAKALKSLQFANPGRQTEFTPETSTREKRRQTKTSASGQTIPSKNKVYDSQGILLANGMDLCDCLDEDCMGCFYACRKCGSNKCGIECRCDRKWLYEQIEIEGGEVIRNKHV